MTGAANRMAALVCFCRDDACDSCDAELSLRDLGSQYKSKGFEKMDEKRPGFSSRMKVVGRKDLCITFRLKLMK